MDFIKPGTERDKSDDTDREITGLYVNSTGARKYLAVCEKDHRSGHIWVNIYEHKSKSLKKQIDMTAEVYGNTSANARALLREAKDAKANTAGADGGEDQREPSQKVIVSLGFSKDGKSIAVVMSDQYLDTKAVLYDWVQSDKTIARYEFPHQ